MQVGDLVKYKNLPDSCGFGIVLKIDDDAKVCGERTVLLDLYWFDEYPDYICDDQRIFEVISESR